MNLIRYGNGTKQGVGSEVKRQSLPRPCRRHSFSFNQLIYILGAIMNMTTQTSLKHSLICGLRVAGRGLEASPPGKAIPWRKEIAFKKGIIVILPAKVDGFYTVFDTETFSVVEARGERLTLEP
jgi:hypothetical protein